MRALPCLFIFAAIASGCTDQKCNADADCDDGLLCNGTSSCLLGRCTKSTPLACDDGLACTIDSCSEQYRQCQHSAPDVDHDGYGDIRCVDMTGVPLGIDCDDTDVNRFPSNREVCDTHDEDCDPTTLGGKDTDNDGFVDVACTNPLTDGGVARGTDCDDLNDGIHRGQLERCNRVDDNCNGMIDEGVQVTRYPDADHDGWGTGAGTPGCLEDSSTAPYSGDCDDTNPAMHPGQFTCDVSVGKIRLCVEDGGYLGTACGAATYCHAQPNGTGICF